MPDFFFHIGLELFPISHGATIEPEAWPEGHRLLSPFLDRKSKRSTVFGNNPKRKNDLSTDLSANPSSEHKPHEEAGLSSQIPASYADDKRLDHISIEGTDMSDMQNSTGRAEQRDSHINKGIGTSTNDLQTKGRYVPLDRGTTDSVWGIVHLYRDAEEHQGRREGFLNANATSASDADCTTLAILAVPSYMAPSDLLGFVGENSREMISHFRMIRTARANRYMVLMKFRRAREARRWQEEWNGRLFNTMEPETCHVVFVKSVEISTATPRDPLTFPDSVSGTDPFTDPNQSTRTLGNTKPAPPPTRSLVEFPTCPVCLERMDETTGLLTILCQHVFHCTCLQKWSGGGCPVCRYTHDDFSSHHGASQSKSKSKFLKSGRKPAGGFSFDDYDAEEELACQVCHAESNLWQCLICGNVGCGRYDAAHAFAHHKATQHAFAMDMESKRVWSYIADAYVHRIIANAQDSSDGKLVELPDGADSALEPDDGVQDGLRDDLPSEKLENLSLEYTHLLTSQLESQRVYFEEKVERAADKAARAATEATSAASAAETADQDLQSLKVKYDNTVPGLERENVRLSTRAGKFEELSRSLAKEVAEERAVSGRLMERIKHLEEQLDAGKTARDKAEKDRRELEEMNRDLQFFISGAEKVKEMEGEMGEDVKEGRVSVPEPQQETSKRNRKGKGRR